MIFSFFKKKNSAFNSIEIIIGIAIFVLIVGTIYTSFSKVFDVIRITKIKLLATAIANEQFEIVRNLPYSDVGIENGIPSGKILRTQEIIRSGMTFEIGIVVRNTDDPFDGTIGGTPTDLSPADYKSVEVNVKCISCREKERNEMSFTTFSAPKNLETASENGALFVKVFDANGISVPNANVHIENNIVSPSIIIDETTNNEGLLQIVDAPPGVEAYSISVNKNGYSSERTYQVGDIDNPNPINPHSTVVIQQITQSSFAIDRLSTFNIKSVSETCSPIPSVAFEIEGDKLIGENPDIPKYKKSFSTDGAGLKNINDIEWGTYNFTLEDSTYDLLGINPLFPLNILPNSTQNVELIIAPKMPKSLLITIKDSASLLPLTDVNVSINKGSFNQSKITGRGFLRQTDWSLGMGSIDFEQDGYFFETDGNIDFESTPGEIKLRNIGGEEYVSSGALTSSTFDLGSLGNIYQIFWQPESQKEEVGENSVKFQIATSEDKLVWDFLGPDGTANTFYTISNLNINTIHNGSEYLRYKVFLSTASTSFTPSVSDIALTFTSDCVPSGQVLFSSLEDGIYEITAEKAGYQTSFISKEVSDSFNSIEIILTPQ